MHLGPPPPHELTSHNDILYVLHKKSIFLATPELRILVNQVQIPVSKQGSKRHAEVQE